MPTLVGQTLEQRSRRGSPKPHRHLGTLRLPDVVSVVEKAAPDVSKPDRLIAEDMDVDEMSVPSCFGITDRDMQLGHVRKFRLHVCLR